MNSLEQLNGLVNRALRAVNDAAVCGAQMNIAKRESATNHLVRAIEHLTNVRALIVEADPNLEYHFDAERPATPYMEAVARLVIEAETAGQSGNTGRAEELLRNALALDPPPFAYESIEKKIAALRTSKA